MQFQNKKTKYDIFFIGDFHSDSGPGVANRLLQLGFKNENEKNDKHIGFSIKTQKLARVIEGVGGAIRSKNICMCSFSKFNLIIIWIANKLKKNTFYLMHGYIKYENKINGLSDSEIESLSETEKKLFQNVKKIICVSNFCCNFMMEHEPMYRNKFTYIYNALDLTNLKSISVNNNSKKNYIMSLGGGTNRKNNLTVCKAIQILNQNGNNLKYVIIGSGGDQMNDILSYNFVIYFEKMKREKILKLMNESLVYVQNSVFDTFGLAPIEALYAGSSILISQNMGIVDLFDENINDYIIKDIYDEHEIALKLQRLIKEPNNEKMKKSFNEQAVNPVNVANDLYKKIME